MKRRKFIKQTSAAAALTTLLPADALARQESPEGEAKKHICIFSKHLQWLGYRDMAKLASEIGFTGIDLTVRDGGHVLPERVKQDLPIAVEQIRGEGLEVPMITTGITDATDQLSRDILETAGKLGIGIYRPGWFKYPKGVPVSSALTQASRQMAQLQSINRANNIAVSYQNHAGLYVGSSGWDLLKMIDGLDPLWTGVQFDIRHAMVEGPNTWPVFLELLSPYINSIDIKDYTWKNDGEAKVVNVPLGEGMVPFEAYLEALKGFGISTPVSIHCEYPLGGAEHGASSLSISREQFFETVKADLSYFTNLYAHQ
ncbi:MAG: sugar phosphate isomerase/epimerase family protein [Bacteroides sp.]|nr:sugar phosphate isomerase/epimerase family protein [Bacteroides sp.]